MKKTANKKPGRPATGQKPQRIFRIGDEDWLRIKRAAARAGLTTSDWIRQTLLQSC